MEIKFAYRCQQRRRLLRAQEAFEKNRQIWNC